MRKIRKFFRSFPSPLPLIFIILGTTIVILYGRGYRPDLSGRNLKPTGLLSATSDPKGAQVVIDGKIVTATDNTINVDPGWYLVTISKEGYMPWQKKIRVQGEVVSRTDPFLFPTSPSLSPLTTVGVQHPTLSPDGTKIAYTIPVSNNLVDLTRAGLWIYELADRTLGFSREQRQVGLSSSAFNFSGVNLTWSPDSSQIMVSTSSATRIYQTNRTDDFQDVTKTSTSILRQWASDSQTLERQKLASFKQPIIDLATSSAKIIAFSPDETKLLYEATASATIPQVIVPGLIGTNSNEEKRTIEPGKIYVYDAREDKNFLILSRSELPQPTPSPSPKIAAKTSPSPLPTVINPQLAPIHWFPTSRHLVLTLDGKIDIMEYDRTNWVTVYSGPFLDGFMAPYPNGSRIIIMTNLNSQAAALPNLYTVNLR